MQNNNELPEEENLSDNLREKLQIENELLKIKMMAESGAVFVGGEGISPEMENQFLNNVLEFETKNSTIIPKKIKDILDNPIFEPEGNLNDKTFNRAYKELNALLKKHYFHVDFRRERSDRFKYNFITRELFEHDTSFFAIQGMTCYLNYEDFHPDHEMDIKETTVRFLEDFLERKLTTDTFYVEKQIAEPEGNFVSRENFMKRFEMMYEATNSFENFSFEIKNTHFDLQENNEGITGMGYSEGSIKYDIVFQNKEREIIYGPFKIYFTRTWDVWGIIFLYLAGFNMHRK